MTDIAIEYLIDAHGNPSAVVIPITLWRQIFPETSHPPENIAETIEDYCLNRAMDEAQTTPLLGREEALKFLEEETD
jgi:hypothetical protein